MKTAFFDAKEYEILAFKTFSDNTDLEIKFFETRLGPDTVELAKGFDCVCVFVNDNVDAEVIKKLAQYGIKLIALRCAGFNNVDLSEAYRQKIHVVRVPAYSPHAVAEHTMALLLTSIRRIHKAYNRTRDFNFSLSGLTGFDLHGKTVGIIGTGRIGEIFIRICQGFGMETIAYDQYPKNLPGVTYTSLNDLFEKSDIISLHCPLTEETHHLINSGSIAQMKKGVVILNTSRGGLINSEALLKGIKERKVGAACLDVYEEESNLFFEDKSGHIMNDDTLARLISMPNVIVTSHQAFLTQEALENIAKTTIGNIQDYLENGQLENEICYHCGSQAECKRNRKSSCF